MNENTVQLHEGVQLTSIVEPKFKTSTLSVVMLVPSQPEQNAKLAMVRNLLLNSCAKYPNSAKMSEKMQELYGAALNSSIGVIGSTWQADFSVTAIADAYALEGEKLTLESAELLLECLLHPNVKDNAFDETAFRTERQELLDTLESEINNKRSYAIKKARRTIFKDECNAYPVYGTKEEVLALTPEAVYETYQELFEKAQILIYHIAPVEVPELTELLSRAFAERKAPALTFQAVSPRKPEPVTVTECMDVQQCQLLMAFKIPEVSQEALRMCSLMYGGAPFSLLFSNVREKESLCYYCSSSVFYGKNTLLVSSGVSPENLERTQQAILEQLDLLRNGEFEDKLLTDAQRYLINALRLSGDTPSSCLNEVFETFIREDHAGMQERIALYQKITREDIIQTANALRLDSVYILRQEEKA